MSDPARDRLLIVDDEDAILETMTFTFEDDYDVLTAGSAEAGLALLEETGPVSVVISDQRMPGTTGVEFLSQVYGLHPATARIILTGFADMDATIKAINDGHVYAYVTKPWEQDDLRQVVRRAVDFYRLRIENEALLADLGRSKIFLEAVMDQLDTGALALNPEGIVQAANRAVLDYLGIDHDPRGHPLKDVLSDESGNMIYEIAVQLAGEDSYEEVNITRGESALHLRVSQNRLKDAEGQQIGTVILLREISHEPLRRQFEDAVQELAAQNEGMRAHLERSVEELSKLASQARGASVRSSGMAELEERATRTITAMQNWLDVEDTIAREEYPDAQLLMDRMRVAQARWPLPEAVPAPVTELAKRVEAYYESGENPRQRVL
ncbi:MAG: response regulator [Deltaproteobacteria bacterium]|nr:response regulator [Deltaproteobacteria bacterium]MBW2446848.1 response regulator [Deltaproteobacteria bacterium]